MLRNSLFGNEAEIGRQPGTGLSGHHTIRTVCLYLFIFPVDIGLNANLIPWQSIIKKAIFLPGADTGSLNSTTEGI